MYKKYHINNVFKTPKDRDVIVAKQTNKGAQNFATYFGTGVIIVAIVFILLIIIFVKSKKIKK